MSASPTITDRVNEARSSSLEKSERTSAELGTLLDTLQAAAPIGIGFIDRDLRVVRVNDVLAGIIGSSVQACLGREVSEVVPHLWPTLKPLYHQVMEAGAPTVNRQITGSTDADPTRTCHWLGSCYPVLLDDEIIGVGVMVVDITEQANAERALFESEARYRAIADTAREGVWTVNTSGQTQYANNRAAELLGLPLSEVYRRTLIELLDPEATGLMAERLLTRHERGPEEYDVTYRHPDGANRILHLSVSPLSDDTGGTGSLSMITDITAVRAAEVELRHLALHDSLTGLPNRALLRDRLDHALARQRRADTGPVAVLVTDLDQFKLVNDTWGHAVGDELLQQIAERLQGAVRLGDTLARFGSDEFVVVAEETTEEAARALADRMLASFAEPFDIASGQRVYVGASLGIAVTPPRVAEKLLAYADAAMYDAKGRGRGRIRVFDAAVAEQAADRLSLSTDLRHALAEDQLELHYQPIVDLSTGTVTSAEALLRWTHPTRGPLQPAQFVAIAEATGLAKTLDRWVLDRACADLGRLRSILGPQARVSVNLSAKHLGEADLEEHVLAALRARGAPADGLTLEITETALMDDPAQARTMLTRLRAQGIQIAIDDFGTGYSCLGYLTQLPVDILKIDRCFIERLTDDPDAFAIVAAIVDLARTLRLSTVAEGVEKVEQIALLRRLQCSTGQGFSWSPAVPLEDLEATLRALPAQRYPVPGNAAGRPPRRTRHAHATTEHGVQQIMRMHRDGASLATIASALNVDGYRTPEGLRWHRASVARAISTVAYPEL